MTSGPSARTAARSITFSSSRTLPGQAYRRRHGERLGREAAELALQLPPVALEEVLGERRDVPRPLAERRQGHAHDVEAVVEVQAEEAVPDGGPEVAVGRGDEADVGLDRPRPADALEGLVLEDAQELRLERGADVADLVEEHRPAVGDLELPALLLVRAREGALLVAEQLGLEELLARAPRS